MDNGNIIDFEEFLTDSLENELFLRLEQCRILRIQVSDMLGTTWLFCSVSKAFLRVSLPPP
jgi:hypothetical protein